MILQLAHFDFRANILRTYTAQISIKNKLIVCAYHYDIVNFKSTNHRTIMNPTRWTSDSLENGKGYRM